MPRVVFVSLVLMKLAQRQVLSLLVALHRIAPEKQVAFAARLKHLQRLGFPAGVNTGKGRPAIYGPRETVQLALAIELMQLGLTPERVANILTHEQALPVVIAKHFVQHMKDGVDDPTRNLIVHLDPSALSEIALPCEGSTADVQDVSWNDASDFSDRYLTGPNHFFYRRRALIDATEMMANMAYALAGLSICSPTEFATALRAWVDEDHARQIAWLSERLEGYNGEHPET